MEADNTQKEDYSDVIKKFEEESNGQFTYTKKELGSGSFGKVIEVRSKQKFYAMKIIEVKPDSKIHSETQLALELKGINIIKINKIYEKNVKGKNYYLVLMEKAALKDLGKLTDFYYKHNLLKTLYSPFYQHVGENLLRYYVFQIIKGLEVIEKNKFVHFDIKPENILVSINLVLKLTDFSLLRDLKTLDKNTITPPGGTTGYFTPEYFTTTELSLENAKKQDYFALGCTIFYLKFGRIMVRNCKYNEKIMNSDRIIDIISKTITFIKSQPLVSNDFKYFLINLIQYRPEDRLDFEHIFRNKWLNDNLNIIKDVINGFENDEEKMILEFQKNDFLIEKKKYIENNKKKVYNNGKKFIIEKNTQKKYLRNRK